MASRPSTKKGFKSTRVPSRHRSTSSMQKELATLRINQTDDSKSLAVIHSVPNELKFHDDCKTILDMMIVQEYKAVKSKPRKDNSEEPDIILEPNPCPPLSCFVHSKNSQLAVQVMRGFFTDKHYRIRISTALDMSSGGTGLINSTISNSVLTSNTQFVALSQVFNEFFVEKFLVSWQPVSRYNYPLTGVTATSVSSAPLGKASLQHGQTAYTSLGGMASNYVFKYHNTGDPFRAEWVNVEKSSSPTVVTTTGVTQAWTSVGNVANYQGSLQFRTQIPPPLPATQVIGTFATHFFVLFRVKI